MSLAVDTTAGEEIIGVLTAACASAWKSGRNVVGSSDVLIELTRRMKPFRNTLSQVVRNLIEERAARESIDYCSRSQDSVATGDKVIDCEVFGTLHEAHWLARRRLGQNRNQDEPDWCQCVHVVLGRVFRDAGLAGVRDPQAVHLLLGIFGEVSSGAHRMMSDLGIDVPAVQRASVSGGLIRVSGSVYAPAYRMLMALGAVSSSGSNKLRLIANPLGWMITRKTGLSAVAFAIGSEAIRQAVRADSSFVGVSHVLVAVSAIDYQRTRLDWRYKRAYDEHNDGGDTLARWGLGYPAVARLLACRSKESQSEVDLRHPWRVEASDPAFDMPVAQVFQQARDLAADLNHRGVGSDHLLMCSLTNDAADIGRLLNVVGVNVDGLRRDSARRLGIAES